MMYGKYSEATKDSVDVPAESPNTRVTMQLYQSDTEHGGGQNDHDGTGDFETGKEQCGQTEKIDQNDHKQRQPEKQME